MRAEELTPAAYTLTKAAERARDHPLAHQYGNASNVPKPKTASKLATEQCQRLVLGTKSEGLYNDLKRLWREYREKICFKGDLKGFLRIIGEEPFHVGFWRKEQLVYVNKIFSQARLNDTLSVWQMDATGTLVSTAEKSLADSKRVYLHSLIVSDFLNPEVNVANSFSVGDFLTSDQSVPYLQFFLNLWLYHQRGLSKSSVVIPKVIVLDQCAAQLTAVCTSFNQTGLRGYAVHCWNVVHYRLTEAVIESYSYLHHCAAHGLHNAKF